MFSSFGATTQSSSPAVNPFAPKPQPKINNPFATNSADDSSSSNQNKRRGRVSEVSDSEAKRKSSKPFKAKDADVSDGGRSKGKRGEDKGKKPNASRKNGPNGDVKSGKRHLNPFLGNEASANDTTDASRPTSSSSATSTDFTTLQPLNSMPPRNSDPHARKVYTQLHKDGISPPNWPSQPGDPGSSAAMSKFRERYEKYRSDVRKSLTKAGLIDDPNKRRALKDAIEFKGISEDMCPEYEKITRITESDVNQPEKDPKIGHPATSRMIKKLARSAAGQEAPLPMDVRSVPTLRRTLDYLIDDLLRLDGNLPSLHGFLWDRTRAIRRDFTFFSTLTPDELKMQVYVLENIARFHVTALHLLSQKDIRPEDFVEQQELEQLGKTLLSLRDLYDDCSAQNITCDNETEFRAYYLLFHAQDPNILETLQRSWKPSLWKDSDEVRTAVSLVEALQNTQDFHGPLKEGPSLAASGAYHAYFRIVEDPSVSYTMACFAECHFVAIRRSILRSVTRALARPKEETKDVTAATLNRFLRFDTVDEAIKFAELHGLEFEVDGDDPSDAGRQRLILRHRQQLPHVRLNHQFSQTMVEKKRGSRKLPMLIHQTVFEDPSSQNANQTASKDSLFVADTMQQTPKKSPFGEPQKPIQSPFSAAFGQPPGGLSSTLSNGVAANQGSQANPNPFNTFSSQPQQAGSSPFSKGFQATSEKPVTNQFGAPSQSGASLGASGFGGSFATSAKEADETSQTTKGNENAKLNPFASLVPPTTNEISPFLSGQGQKGAAQVESSSNVTTTEPNPKAPTFNFSTSTPQPTPSAIGLASGSSILPTTAPDKAAQTVPSLSSLKPTTTTQPPSFSPVTDKASTQKLTLDMGLPSSTLPPDQARKPFQVNKINLSFPESKPADSAPAVQTSSLSIPATSTVGTQVTPAAPPPPCDLMGDFTKWFVNGDHGLMEDFQVYMVGEILKEVYEQWSAEEEERKQREEEERINAEVEAFRVYNLRVKFFYRWKNNARTKRLRYLRRSGREQFRAYHAAKREEEREAARLSEEKAQASQPDRSKEMTELLRRKRVRSSQAEEDLIASGVLSGVGNEREHAARIVRKELNPWDSKPLTNGSSRASSSGSTTKRAGGKSQAIREQLLLKKTEGFRRSLPSIVSRSTASTEPSRHASNVSERWRLKAMGIVQMPDGTAMPNNMANEFLYGGKKYPGLGPRPRASSYSTSERPRLPTSAAQPDRQSLLSRSYGTEEPPPTNKRKRAGDDTEEVGDEAETDPPQKRVMSENEKLISELRAMREELEEGASWFRSQTERLQSEVQSRGTTPWDDSI